MDRPANEGVEVCRQRLFRIKLGAAELYEGIMATNEHQYAVLLALKIIGYRVAIKARDTES